MKLLTYILFICWSHTSYSAVTSKDVNLKVNRINDNIANYNVMNLSLTTDEFESLPPQITYYFDINNDLKLAKITVSKGLFGIEYSYYFEDNQPLKYSVVYDDHPDNLGKEAIIYADNKPIWKNVKNPRHDPETILKSFKASLESLTSFL
ncbi:hypothetical protein [Photobacterium nomapromontoriensis]|uniref:hypothetical protein n=1 Tax=Photobacterium nomapromontoriensis TaxID=2910237 RepID=UPI003D09B41C